MLMTNFFKTLVVGVALTFSAAANAELANLSVTVSNVTSNEAEFEITCDDANVPFYYQVVPSVRLTPFGGVTETGIYDFQKNQWEGYGKDYDCPWTDFIGNAMINYEKVNDKASEWTKLVGGMDYVVYALGMDPEGNLTTNVAYKEFKVTAAEPSRNTFDISLVGVAPMENRPDRMAATFKVTPSNNDTYVVKYYGKEFVDKYGDLTPGTDGYIKFLTNLLWDVNESSLLTGEQTMTFDRLMPDNEFYLTVVGMDANMAPTTTVTKFAFTSATGSTGEDPEELGTLSIEVSNVTSRDADYEITCDNDKVMYYCQTVPAYKLVPFGGANETAIYAFQKAEWESFGKMYDCPWTDFIASSMTNSGTTNGKASDWISVVGGVDYVVFALGMDPEGNLTTNVAFKEFKAVAGEPSQNTFDVSLASVAPMEKRPDRMAATFKVTPSNNDSYVIEYYGKETIDKYGDLTPGTEGYVKFMTNLMWDVTESSLVTGEQTVSFDRLMPDQEFYLTVVGMDANMAPTTPVTTFAFTSSLKQPEDPEVPKNTIDLKITDVKNMDAHLVLTPSDPEMLYYMDVSRAESVEAKGGIENIPNALIIDWWKWLADMYGMDWTELIPMQTTKGSLDCNLSELIEADRMSDIWWGTDYVIYAVGFDEKGNIISNTAAVEFTTTKPEKNENLTFEFKPVSIVQNERFDKYYDATLEVTPSNDNDEYMTEYCKTRIIDQYYNGSLDREYTEDEIVISQFVQYGKFHKGPSTVECLNLEKRDARGDVEYYVIAMGWNDGLTTPIYKYKFNFDTEIPGSGVTLEKYDEPVVVAMNGRIEVSGNYDAAAVFSMSGQLIGSMRPGRSVSVEPGVYVVHYLADGVNHTVKVMVK